MLFKQISDDDDDDDDNDGGGGGGGVGGVICKYCLNSYFVTNLAPPRRLCSTRRLSVCLSKTTDWVFMKILPERYLWMGKNRLNLGISHPDFFISGGLFSLSALVCLEFVDLSPYFVDFVLPEMTDVM